MRPVFGSSESQVPKSQPNPSQETTPVFLKGRTATDQHRKTNTKGTMTTVPNLYSMMMPLQKKIYIYSMMMMISPQEHIHRRGSLQPLMRQQTRRRGTRKGIQGLLCTQYRPSITLMACSRPSSRDKRTHKHLAAARAS